MVSFLLANVAVAIVLLLHLPESAAFATMRVPNPSPIRLAQSGTLFDGIDASEEVRGLPLHEILDDVRECLGEKPNLLLEAAPGAGKTTLVPLLITGDGGGATIQVEPRRVAARAAAQRMSGLLGRPVGDTVGYAIRGESRRSSKTSVMVMTDGVILSILQKDPELTGYDAVILDEFHERGVGSDTALALLREVQTNYRPDLKIIVMSATLLGDADSGKGRQSAGAKLLKILGGKETCNTLRAKGRQYPVTIQYSGRAGPRQGALLRDTKLLVKTVADAVEEGLSKAPGNGDVLAFLPGAKEIRRVTEELKTRGHTEVLPLYGSLPKHEQDNAIFKGNSDRQRVIVSSPIAEASLTIDGVEVVVDSGLQRQPRYDAKTGLSHLVTVACSRDAVVQRAGRAGRTRDGHCLRLFSEAEFENLPEHANPEICSTDLSSTVLLLSEWGCTSLEEVLRDLPFVDAPPKDALKKAYQMLVDIGALEEYTLNHNKKRKFYKMTDHGSALARMATHPRLGTSILKAEGGAALVATVAAAALMDQDGLALRGRRDPNLALVIRDALNNGPNSPNSKKLLKFASRISEEAKSAVSSALSGGIPSDQVFECVGASLLPGFVDLIGQRKGEASFGSSTYMLSLGRSARLDGRSEEGKYIVVVDTSTGDDGATRIRAYSEIYTSKLHELASEKEEVYTVASNGYLVRKRRVLKVGSLVLSSTTLPSPSTDEVAEALLDAINSLGGVSSLVAMQTKKRAAAIVQLLLRSKLAWQSGEAVWPQSFASFDAIQDGKGTEEDERTLVDMVEPWLGAATSLKSLDFLSILQSELTPEQQGRIDALFPTSIKAPDMASLPITYDQNGRPVASAKLQQFFGQKESPTVGPPGKTIPVTLSLLSPSGKPLALTVDLPFFWRETYPLVRAEMRGRYPKHPWPEDPMSAIASRLTTKQQMKRSPQTLDQRTEGNKRRRRKR